MLEDEKNYNFVVSNIILSQRGKFTYNDIIKALKSIYKSITETLKNAVNNCLIRLREDGFLSVLGTSYFVTEIDI